jgi:hypothetical protein
MAGSAARGAADGGLAIVPAAEAPTLQLAVKAVDCGSCFELSVSASGGAAPYRYEWDDGSRSQNRRVCVEPAGRNIWVVVEDAAAVRSRAYATHLEAEATNAVGCGSIVVSKPLICLTNPSFEGTAAFNDGQAFDAVPWSQCTDPSKMDASTSNTPDIANESVQPQIGVAPVPTQGNTYLALGVGEQASQALCEPINANAERSLKLDLTRVPLPVGVSDETEGVQLEIWGGLAADCSQRQLLWVSPTLESTWRSRCVTLRPTEYMDQITLRAKTSMPNLTLNYLAVDNLVPVAACP